VGLSVRLRCLRNILNEGTTDWHGNDVLRLLLHGTPKGAGKDGEQVSEKPGRDLTLGDIHNDHNALENLQGYVAELVLKIQALEAKAKEPEKSVPFHVPNPPDGVSCHPGSHSECELCNPPKPSGWRAREYGTETWPHTVAQLIEVHPRAVRVRMHRFRGKTFGEWCDLEICDGTHADGYEYRHADFLQISGE
jgi:hypothetical protein